MHDNEVLNLSPSPTAESREQALNASHPHDYVQYTVRTLKLILAVTNKASFTGRVCMCLGNGYTRLCLAQTPL